MEERNGIMRSWNGIHLGWKIAVVIFFAGSAYAGYTNLKADVEQLKSSQADIVQLQRQADVLTEKVTTLQKKLEKMDDKLDKIIQYTE